MRLSNLVGAGGLWYGFGKTIMDMYVTYDCRTLHRSVNSSSRSLSDEQANEMSDMLSKVRPISPNLSSLRPQRAATDISGPSSRGY